nr:MAG TPA: hypothetical protein [Caudoviricetes sp.]
MKSNGIKIILLNVFRSPLSNNKLGEDVFLIYTSKKYWLSLIFYNICATIII